MADWNKPLPTVSGESKPYWDSCRLGVWLYKNVIIVQSFNFILAAFVLIAGRMISNGIPLLVEALCGPLQLPIKIEPLGLRKMCHMY